MNGRFKIFSDPVHGFISVPRELILELVGTADVQRLRRIRQLGVGHMVFPGAEHSRFGHALGAMALMHDTLASLSEKGADVSREEWFAALAAALLHDIGHGPFSHTLEHELIDGIHHEMMSRALIDRLNRQLGGRLDLTLRMFDGTYERRWFHTLIASQLDMDRLDYLRRDSFYTGVVEGRVGVDRIIKTLRVTRGSSGDEEVVVEAKGSYAVENYLIARRLMYMQVYLHKTVLAGDHLLRSVLRRVRSHIAAGREDVVADASSRFLFFLRRSLRGPDALDDHVLDAFRLLDDTDIIYSLKQWMHADDPVLADFSRRILVRDFFRVEFDDELVADRDEWRTRVRSWLLESGISTASTADEDLEYYLLFSEIRHEAYDAREDSIGVLKRDGSVAELSAVTGTTMLSGLTDMQVRRYVCYPKEAAR
ncbi:MAG: HD domain-containing protein [Rhodothermales bacterium]|nr:HD domain-containing protein [Rhodothermales bacterium]